MDKETELALKEYDLGIKEVGPKDIGEMSERWHFEERLRRVDPDIFSAIWSAAQRESWNDRWGPFVALLFAVTTGVLMVLIDMYRR